jgi:hypothetical protein
MNKFLTAKWHDLVMVNYEVDPKLLAKYLPEGTTLDFWEGECYVSLVAFKFIDTAVMGIKVPFHTNFEEVNLRFYVKRETKKEVRHGVTFVKEIVPRMMISAVARVVYGEPYETWQMSHQQSAKELSYYWQQNGCKNHITVETGENLGVPDLNSHGEFIIEHYWGYTKRGMMRTDEYKVEHPKWELIDITYAEVDVDFAKTYGEQFAFLTDAEPRSMLMAKGSDISVYKGEKLVLK